MDHLLAIGFMSRYISEIRSANLKKHYFRVNPPAESQREPVYIRFDGDQRERALKKAQSVLSSMLEELGTDSYAYHSTHSVIHYPEPLKRALAPLWVLNPLPKMLLSTVLTVALSEDQPLTNFEFAEIIESTPENTASQLRRLQKIGYLKTSGQYINPLTGRAVMAYQPGKKGRATLRAVRKFTSQLVIASERAFDLEDSTYFFRELGVKLYSIALLSMIHCGMRRNSAMAEALGSAPGEVHEGLMRLERLGLIDVSERSTTRVVVQGLSEKGEEALERISQL